MSRGRKFKGQRVRTESERRGPRQQREEESNNTNKKAALQSRQSTATRRQNETMHDDWGGERGTREGEGKGLTRNRLLPSFVESP